MRCVLASRLGFLLASLAGWPARRIPNAIWQGCSAKAISRMLCCVINYIQHASCLGNPLGFIWKRISRQLGSEICEYGLLRGSCASCVSALCCYFASKMRLLGGMGVV